MQILHGWMKDRWPQPTAPRGPEVPTALLRCGVGETRVTKCTQVPYDGERGSLQPKAPRQEGIGREPESKGEKGILLSCGQTPAGKRPSWDIRVGGSSPAGGL